MTDSYTFLRPEQGRILALVLVFLFAFCLPSPARADDEVRAFAGTLDAFSDRPRPFPEKFEMFDFSDASKKLTFGPEQPWRLINFWAAWCAPCILELPSLKALQDKAPKEFSNMEVYLVSMDMPSDGKALKYLIKQKNLPDIEAQYVKDFWVNQTFEMEGLPTTVLVTPEGRIAYTFTGDAEWDSKAADAFFRKVLAAPSKIP